jgi:hypothetical protein
LNVNGAKQHQKAAFLDEFARFHGLILDGHF